MLVVVSGSFEAFESTELGFMIGGGVIIRPSGDAFCKVDDVSLDFEFSSLLHASFEDRRLSTVSTDKGALIQFV